MTAATFQVVPDLMKSIWLRFSQLIFNVEVTVEEEQQLQLEPESRLTGPPSKLSEVTYQSGAGVGATAIAAAAAGAEAAAVGQLPPPEVEVTEPPLNREQRRAMEREQRKQNKRKV